MALKVLSCLRAYSRNRIEVRERVDEYYARGLLSKGLRSLQTYYLSHHVKCPAENGHFIRASMRWLSQVFPSISTTRDTHRSGSKLQILSELNSLKYSASSPRAVSESRASTPFRSVAESAVSLLPAPMALSSRSHYSHFHQQA